MMVAVKAVAMMGDIDVMYILWSPEFSESLDRQGIHQLAATCKIKRRR